MKTTIGFLYIIFCIMYFIGYIICIVKFVNSDFKPSYKRELIYGISLATGVGGITGYLNIEDKIE